MAAFVLLWLPGNAAANTRTALLIGNSAYAVGPLSNPRADVHLVASALEKSGFSVEKRFDLDRKELFAAIDAFSRRAPKDGVALVYYAGHGMQISGRNLLIPVNMVPTSEAGVIDRAVPVQILIDKMTSSNAAVSVVVLDACRNNPFKAAQRAKSRGIDDLGLAEARSPKGMLIAYSTAPGQLAEDGAGKGNSVYAQAFSEELLKPGLTIEEVLKRVGDRVRRASYDDQQPWFESSLVVDFRFTGAATPIAAAKALPPRPAAMLASAQRGMAAGEAASWYAPLKTSEWQALDREITRRAQNMTEEELPSMAKRARSGSVVAQTVLGIGYRIGWRQGEITAAPSARSAPGRTATARVKANNTEALRYLRMAADAGFPIAQCELGEMYFEGRGVDQSRSAAQRWMEAAAAFDYPRARINLAQLRMGSENSPEAMMNLFQEMVRPVVAPPSADSKH